MISTLEQIHTQGNAEIFFVDWERTEVVRPKDLEEKYNDISKKLRLDPS